MGFLGGGFFGSGAKENTGNSETTSSVDSSNTNFGGGDGDVGSVNNQRFGDVSNSTIELAVTDHGAVASGQNVSVAALDFAEDAFDSALEGAAGISGDAFYTAGNIAEQSIDLAMSSQQSALDFSGYALSEVLDESNDNFEFFTQQVGQAFDRNLEFATNANTSENAQVAKDGLKMVMVGGGVLVAAMISMSLFKG